MSFFDRLLGRSEPEKRERPDSGTIAVSDSNFLAFFGVDSKNLPHVTVDNALSVPAFGAAVSFLSGSMANLPLHLFRGKDEGAERVRGTIDRVLNEAPNSEWTSFYWRKYMWQGVWTHGRGLSWIERNSSGTPVGIWPLEHGVTQIIRRDGKKFYQYGTKNYPARDIIDVPFLLKDDQLSSHAPITMGAKAVQLALAMNDYGSNFFAGGGVPPLALEGPLPQGADAMKRAKADIMRSINSAKDSKEPLFPLPPGHSLNQVGYDPEKGQMTDARRFQIEEIARIFNLPPVFLQDLTHGTFSNTSQQDLHLTKHLIAQWAKAFEQELNLKLFGERNNNRYVEHNLNALQRGDFKTRMDGYSLGVQNAILTPNEARGLENRPPKDRGDDLLVQGGTVPLGQQKMQGDLFDPSQTSSDDTAPAGANQDEA